MEEQRKELILLQGANARQEAENRGQALLREAEYQSQATALQLALYKGMEPRTLLAHALKQLGENAGRIGNLTITTDVLAGLLGEKAE